MHFRLTSMYYFFMQVCQSNPSRRSLLQFYRPDVQIPNRISIFPILLMSQSMIKRHTQPSVSTLWNLFPDGIHTFLDTLPWQNTEFRFQLQSTWNSQPAIVNPTTNPISLETYQIFTSKQGKYCRLAQLSLFSNQTFFLPTPSLPITQ